VNEPTLIKSVWKIQKFFFSFVEEKKIVNTFFQILKREIFIYVHKELYMYIYNSSISYTRYIILITYGCIRPNRYILAKISNAPLLHLKIFKTLSEFTINWYWYPLRFTQLNCQGPQNCNQICNYSTVSVIVEKHVEQFPPVFGVHLLKIKYPHVL
jgi:hypothetical protein